MDFPKVRDILWARESINENYYDLNSNQIIPALYISSMTVKYLLDELSLSSTTSTNASTDSHVYYTALMCCTDDFEGPERDFLQQKAILSVTSTNATILSLEPKMFEIHARNLMTKLVIPIYHREKNDTDLTFSSESTM